jgi:hypothetical protein
MAHHPFPWTDAFLASLREVPVVARACEAVGIERSTAYRRRDADEAFAAAWDDAMEAGVDKAEQEAFRRAVEGTDKGVWHQGALVGSERVYSDALLSLILKGRRKKVYADRTELTGADGGPMVQQVDDTTRSARVAQLMALAEARKAGAASDDDETAGGLV